MLDSPKLRLNDRSERNDDIVRLLSQQTFAREVKALKSETLMRSSVSIVRYEVGEVVRY